MKLKHYVCACSRGSGTLDIVLFMPLALLFLFVLTDAGLGFVEKASITDAIRAGINAAGMHTNQETLFKAGPENQLEVERVLVQNLVDGVARGIVQRVNKGKFALQKTRKPRFAVEVTAILVGINTDTGALNSSGPYTMIATSNVPGNNLAEYGENASGVSYVTRENFIEQELKHEQGILPSSYSVPLGLAYRADRPGTVGFKYLDNSLILYVEVRNIAEGINPSYTEAVLGRLFTLQEQQLHLVRAQLH
jgi:hypothetical protein